LWVAFPFDPAASAAQPEVAAQVVRSSVQDQTERWAVALEYRRAPGLPGGKGAGNGTARKNGSRDIALPIRVRPPNMPWHEEAMTFEVAPGKVRFVTNREYAFGERLLISFDARSDAPWSGDEEWEGEVTGIEMDATSDAVTVTVRRKS